MVMAVDKVTKQEMAVFSGNPDEEVRYCEERGWMLSDEHGNYRLGTKIEEDLRWDIA